MKKIILILLLISLFSINVNAQINLTFQSENEQIIKITDLTSFNTISLNKTNDIINLPYNNYIVTLYPDSTKLNNGTIINNTNSFVNDRYKFIWIAIIFMIIILAFLFIKRL